MNEALLQLPVFVATEIATRSPVALLISSLLTRCGASPHTRGITYQVILQYGPQYSSILKVKGRGQLEWMEVRNDAVLRSRCGERKNPAAASLGGHDCLCF